VLGLNVTVGYGGELVLAHGATIAIGAYAAAPIILGAGLSLILGMLVGGLLTGMVAVAFGLPSYRVKGFYLAISTLTLQFISNWFFRTGAFEVIHGGKQQVLPNKADLLAGSFLVSSGYRVFYCVALVVLCSLRC